MTIRWNLPTVMYSRGVFSATQLRKMLLEKVGFEISVPAVHRMVNGLPKEFKFSTLDALCQTLECQLDDIIEFEEPTAANQCVQPLILECTYRHQNGTKKKKVDQIKVDLPPI